MCFRDSYTCTNCRFYSDAHMEVLQHIQAKHNGCASVAYLWYLWFFWACLFVTLGLGLSGFVFHYFTVQRAIVDFTADSPYTVNPKLDNVAIDMRAFTQTLIDEYIPKIIPLLKLSHMQVTWSFLGAMAIFGGFVALSWTVVCVCWTRYGWITTNGFPETLSDNFVVLTVTQWDTIVWVLWRQEWIINQIGKLFSL